MTDTSLPAPGRVASPGLGAALLAPVGFLALAIVLIAIPAFDPSRSGYSLLSLMGTNIVFALSFNMLLGRAGLLSFGHAVYFGLGGYACVHLMSAMGDGGLATNFPVLALPIVGFAAGALAGVVIGWPSCRRAGIPFAMISLGIAQLIATAGIMFVSVFGGEEGVSGNRMAGPELFGLSMGPNADVYWFVAFWTFVGTLLIYLFTKTPLGRLSEAVRDNPERVEFVGYDPQRVRYLVFIFAGGFAGLAGGMSAVNFEIFTPESLSLVPSAFVLLMAYIGGIRYFAGPIIGAVVFTYMQSNLSDYSEAWLLYLGLLFIAVVMFAPSGLAGIIVGLWRGVTRPGAPERLGRWLGATAAGALAFVGTVIIVEVSIRLSNGYGEVFEPFGIALPGDNPFTWLAGILPIVFGVWLLNQRLSFGESSE